ncbi:flagellar export protein FliJ [Anaerocolumna xylanovorans]|uniref:Flagellar FliJ protein n=1 Tax=Anaerocolumna xylanovorans DSM 12503 TaxID=1121345 RepID=A0A1M7YB49_9FIRM|nr:flagellar export protein FliJ [Anaerocolumna xylanovorans]SHO49874.1 flagellar FliJ protein [Anaerocolumna xylanovorans DSM 12503]
MAKFIYKMESILGIKYKMEDQAKISYGIARRKLMKEEDRLHELNIRLEGYQNKGKELRMQKLNICKLREYTEASEAVKKEIKLQELAVRRAEQQVELARQRLNAAMLERKTHEKLKENAKEVFFLELASGERKEIDELVSFRYNNPTN